MPTCANVKNKKSPNEQCSYPAKKGEFCSRHYKNPQRFQNILLSQPISTRSITNAIKKVQRWWKKIQGFKLAKERTPAFFYRDLCHNDSELASLEPLSTVPRDYFFVIKDSDKFWGYDIRTLLVQYENSGKLENMYTTQLCSPEILESFRLRLDHLRRWKKSLVFESASNLSVKQSWNLRVLDACLRLDMLGYRISTQWFSELNISEHRILYNTLASMWNQDLNLSEDQRRRIVPEHNNPANKLFRWTPEKINMKHDMDSIRRTNLNIMERLITSASQQSDKTLGAMYTVMGLCRVSYRCRNAYPWLA